jgi:glycerol-3-phosphate acyltransferase PlsY
MDFLRLAIAAVVGYLLGSVNSSIVVGKFYGVDVRNHGSGNAGATNTLRTLGKTAAGLVSTGDILKGVLACIIGRLIMGDLGLMFAGFASIVGHNWPVYFNFRGGKGVWTSFAVILMMDYKLGLILLGIFAVIVVITRYVSLSSIAASVCFPILAIIVKKDVSFIVFSTLLAALAVYRHRENIKRLINGTESKFGKKKN